jgi:hypothetical protein
MKLVERLMALISQKYGASVFFIDRENNDVFSPLNTMPCTLKEQSKLAVLRKIIGHCLDLMQLVITLSNWN